MFGYLTAERGHLTPEEDARYRAAYCGLCRSLRGRWGTLSGFTLNYDQCFLILLLQSLYEADETNGEDPCIAHPRKARAWWKSRYTDYAADMNVALAYLKCLDDWEDDGNPAALAESRLFKSAYEQIEARWPRQCGAIRRALTQLHELEKNRIEDADAAASAFGELMGEILVLREDRWQEPLRQLGRALGRFIYVMDAVMDLSADAARNRYNPFRRYYGLPDNARRFEDILKMLLGDCLFWFDKLPLVQDLGILQNILCEGLWTQFKKRYSKEESDGTGPV